MQNPYIGITDFMTNQQVLNMLEVFVKNKKPYSQRKLHIGVMMSYKTLNGISTKWENAFPKNEDITKIFQRDENLFNVLHYADYDNVDVLKNLFKATSYAGHNTDGLQLDMVWPDVDVIKKYREQHPSIKIILQGNTKAFELVNNDISSFLSKVADYGDLIEYVLLDKSMGRGLGMDATGLVPIAKALQLYFPNIGVAAAGGLGPNTIHLAEPLVREISNLSIDAQGKLRSSGSALDPIEWELASNYLVEGLNLLD